METRRHLLSSPSRATMQAEALRILSSSPDFPSIDDLLPKREKKPSLRSGSRAAPIPDNALKSFTTASHFWHSTIASEDESAIIGERAASQQDKVQRDLNRPRSVPRDVVSHEALVALDHGLHDQGTTSAPPAPAVQQKQSNIATRSKPKPVLAPESVEEVGLSPQEKPWKKYKGKDAADGQTKIFKGKITKPSAAKPKQARKKAKTVSKHFAPAGAPEPIDIDDDEKVTEPALKRRTDWTPTKNTEQPIIVLDSSTVKDVTSPRLSGADPSLQPRKDIFKNLRDTYCCPGSEDVGRTAASMEEPIDVLGKRKLIEMLTTTKTSESQTSEVSPVKQKAPKKKPRTITELATAAYRVADTADFRREEEQSRDESLLNYFATSEESGLAQTTKCKAAPGKAKGSRTSAKAKPKRVSKKKTEPPQPILLSPASAIRQVSRQDFVFGTSSQLATEVDAGLLRDLQQAMKDSNQREEHDPFASSPADNDVRRKSSAHRLWAAGARNADGDLLEVEVIDLVDSPAIEKDLTNPAVILSLAADTPKAHGEGSGDSRSATTFSEVDVISLSSSLTPTHPKPRFSFIQRQTNTVDAGSVPADASSGAGHQSFPKAADAINLDEGPPASNQEQYHQMASSVPDASAPASHEAPAPKYELYTDAQLAREVRSYGFKPIKRRTAAIALLVQCWSSKNQIRTQTLGQGTTASLSTSSMAAAKAKPSASAPAAAKPRGRPKKVASTAEPSESISASASASAPAPESATKRPRGRPKKDAVPGKTAAAKKPSRATTKRRSSLSPPPAAASGPAPGPSTPKRKRQAPAQPAIEIADSDQEEMEDPFDLSSAASSPAPANEFSSPVPGVELSMTEADDSVLSLTSSPTSQQARLFGYITDAVRTAPRSRDPADPSWHEKMLLYDPIVLEDLAAWLNAGQLDRVGCEEEVSCGDVKKWCESKSVCCLWKVNLNGKERKRF